MIAKLARTGVVVIAAGGGGIPVALNERGEVIAVASHPHTLQTPKPLWSEQDPREWWEAVSASIKSVLEQAGISGEGVGAVGLTGQMHGLILLDDAGNVLLVCWVLKGV